MILSIKKHSRSAYTHTSHFHINFFLCISFLFNLFVIINTFHFNIISPSGPSPWNPLVSFGHFTSYRKLPRARHTLPLPYIKTFQLDFLYVCNFTSWLFSPLLLSASLTQCILTIKVSSSLIPYTLFQTINILWSLSFIISSSRIFLQMKITWLHLDFLYPPN